ncbi:hypothetical protein [Pantoea stewartii]|uniref:Uncharacterized protein n=1 Tax=Pantoea stewartii subsp. stewartii DC283 TaxID=660596 RepID=H3RCR7_PANSE|nr:hypothetical protein [Pantoea stewartii]ARF50290.1 hypothetical protein DSJ_13740 [Pantoea stewartii subsp. stewartii DC283]EHU00844.1 hypothetical protein CKS_3604 [Pantoea stewartii subsp. stewartii DC283]KAB0545405.1 hypothetical protein F7Q90_25010 [Pantoea stewartii subsp. stewartii]
MREYTSDELIIIGRCHALQSERERLLSEIKINQSAMSGISLGYSDEPERLLGLLEEQINLVSAFREIEPDCQAASEAYREVVSGEVKDNG